VPNIKLILKGLLPALVCAVSLAIAVPGGAQAAGNKESASREARNKQQAKQAKSSKTATASAKRDRDEKAARAGAKAKQTDKVAKRKDRAGKNERVARTGKSHNDRNILVAGKKPERAARSSRVERAAVAAAVAPAAVAPARSALPAFAPMSVAAEGLPRGGARAMPMPANGVRTSFGTLYGLQNTPDPLELRSNVAFVVDQDTNEVVFAKNSEAVLPIASLTKLMTAVIVTEAQLPLDELITITMDDVDTEKHSSSRLAVGSTLSRGELLHLALMSSENRAAHALGRTYPGGLRSFVSAMNAKARLLGMNDSHFVDPTGLSSRNQASARDLASLARFAYQSPLIRDLSTSPEHLVTVGSRQLQYRNTNGLVRNPAWDIGLQKTGYIVEAGRCLVMQARLAGRKFIMVFLDSNGKQARLSDAERIRRWIEMAAEEGSLGIYLPRAKLTS
jgi:D-alanyl-D-alanine endopeptidase (penicillin-binding protein 7)